MIHYGLGLGKKANSHFITFFKIFQNVSVCFFLKKFPILPIFLRPDLPLRKPGSFFPKIQKVHVCPHFSTRIKPQPEKRKKVTHLKKIMDHPYPLSQPTHLLIRTSRPLAHARAT
jgi:hypothetical protein